MTHVFISYAEEDANLVGVLEADLIERGHPTWRDRDASNETLQVALNDAYALLSVMTRKASAAPRPRRDLRSALDAGTPVVGLLLEDCEFPVALADEQVIDLSDMEQAQGADLLMRYREGLEQLVDQLDQLRPIILYLRELDDDDVSVRQMAARKLGELDDPSATDALIDALADEDADVRFAAAEALGIKGEEAAVLPLLRLLENDDDDPDVISAAAIALGAIGHHGGVVEVLAVRLEHSDRFVRQAAAQALGELASLEAVAPLVHMMRNDPISDVRAAATTALCFVRARTESPDAARALRRARVAEMDET